MDDLKWLAVVAILTLVSFAYLALLGAGGEESGS
jgi:hypothetical protein